MSEANWPEVYDKILFTNAIWLAQTFTPEISHEVTYIKVKVAQATDLKDIIIRLQYLQPDGTPTGADLTSWFQYYPPYGKYSTPQETIFRTWPPWRLVAGIPYALIFYGYPTSQTQSYYIAYQPPPSDYPRGKLIRSTNTGSTWNTTDLGDLVFAEWGKPPLGYVKYTPTVRNFAILDLTKDHYSTSICIKNSTSQPCHLTLWITSKTPRLLEKPVTQRGLTFMHFGTYSFVGATAYEQLQKGDTLYHSFRPFRLKKNTKYYYCFTGTDDWEIANSVSPIFGQIFPGGPAWELTRRPSAPGNITQLARSGSAPCPQNYCYVKEAASDEFDSCLYNAFPFTKWWQDLYHIPNLDPADSGPIAEVHLTGRFAYKSGYSYASKAYILVKTHGGIYRSPLFSHFGTTFSNRHWHCELNPHTGLPWTHTEIDDLQIGIRLYCYEGVGWATETWCTQLYCKIKHTCRHPI